MADAHAVALQRATTAERDLAQARTTLARTPSEDARRAFHSELESIRETAQERLGRSGLRRSIWGWRPKKKYRSHTN